MPYRPSLDLFSAENAETNDYISLLEKFPYRPTLFLGLGGTGSQAVAKIKDLFTKLYAPLEQKNRSGKTADIPPMYAFRAFDTDRTGRPPLLTDGQEWFHLGVDNLPSFYEAHSDTKEFKDWLPLGMASSSVVAGAGGFRSLGRLCLFHNMNRFNQGIKNALGTILRTDPRLVNPTPVIFLFCSVSGGTGAGMFLDACFYLRENVRNVQITGFLAVLEGLSTMASLGVEKAKVGSYCALRELNGFMTGTMRGYDYGDKIRYPYKIDGKIAKPFDECYLLENRKLDGTINLLEQDHVSSFMARQVFMMTAYSFQSEKTPDYDGVMVNYRDALETRERGTAFTYLVPGMGQVHFPIEESVNLFVLNAAKNYMRYQSSGKADLHGHEEAVNFLSAQGLSYSSLRQEISKLPLNQLPPQIVTYDETIHSLMEEGEKNLDTILGYGSKVPEGRLKELHDLIKKSADRVMQDFKRALDHETSRLLIDADYLTEGTLDFISDLKALIQIERDKLEREDKNTVDPEYAQLSVRWASIKPEIQDVLTHNNIFDKLKDMMNKPRVEEWFVSFLNEAESLIHRRMKNEATLAFFSEVLKYLNDLDERIRRVFKDNFSQAITLLENWIRPLETQLNHQEFGQDGSVEEVCSYNVLTEEWRRTHFANSPHYQPRAILNDALIQGGLHPFQLLMMTPPKGKDSTRWLAQTIIDQILANQSVALDRALTPLDVLGQKQEFRGAKPEDTLAKLIFSLLLPQARISGMQDVLQFAPEKLMFCGGIDAKLATALQQTPQMSGIRFNNAESWETNRINFFCSFLPISLAGCNILPDSLVPFFDKWFEDKAMMKKADFEKQLRFYASFPKSWEWPRPEKCFRGSLDDSKAYFSRALALSEMLNVSASDLAKMDRQAPEPKDKRYGLFQVGLTYFWLWPFFNPFNDQEKISGKPIKLSKNIYDSYLQFEKSDDCLKAAKAWVEWFESNWWNHYRAPELETLLIKAREACEKRKGKTRVPKEVDMWDEVILGITSWLDTLTA